MSIFQESLTGWEFLDLITLHSSLKNGEKQLPVDSCHDSRGVALTAGWDLDVKHPHAPGSSILLPLVQAVLEVSNLISLLGKQVVEFLVLVGCCFESCLQLRDLLC